MELFSVPIGHSERGEVDRKGYRMRANRMECALAAAIISVEYIEGRLSTNGVALNHLAWLEIGVACIRIPSRVPTADTLHRWLLCHVHLATLYFGKKRRKKQTKR